MPQMQMDIDVDARHLQDLVDPELDESVDMDMIDDEEIEQLAAMSDEEFDGIVEMEQRELKKRMKRKHHAKAGGIKAGSAKGVSVSSGRFGPTVKAGSVQGVAAKGVGVGVGPRMRGTAQ